MQQIRDPLYGYIPVSEAELEVIGSPYVQRLRRVHQLGLSSVVYPGASHSRFEHSLGVMYLAGELADSIGLDEHDVTAYRLGGLLHDVGHAPFSHAIERVMEREIGITHETRSCEIVDEIDHLLPVEADYVKRIINGESEYDIVAGDVDVDRMDYLRRDAVETGLEHGNIDTETIIEFAETHEGDIVYSKTTMQALEGLFHARFHMTKSVYSHHTSKIAEAMLERAVDEYIKDDMSLDSIINYDDYQLHTYLLDDDGLAGDLYGRVANRDLYKRAVFLSDVNYDRERLETLRDSIDNPREVEAEIAAEAGLDPSEVIVDLPELPSKTNVDTKIRVGGEIKPFTDVSPIPAYLEESAWRNTIFGVYTPEPHIGDVESAAETVLGL